MRSSSRRSTPYALVGAAAEGQQVAGLLFGVGAIILLPLVYGVMGFIAGVIGAFVYNVCAMIVGGIKFDAE